MAASSSYTNPIITIGRGCRHSNVNSRQDIANHRKTADFNRFRQKHPGLVSVLGDKFERFCLVP